jgi:hypothetical protein
MLGWLLLCWAMASGDVFTNKKTAETIKGQLLGTVTKEGVAMFIVKCEDGQQRLLVMAEWVTQKDKPTHAPAPEERFAWPQVTYEGKVRDASWLEKTYARFKDSVVQVEGKYYEVGGAHLWASDLLLTELDKALRAGRLWDPEGGDVHDAATTAVFGPGEGGYPAAALPGEGARLRPL